MDIVAWLRELRLSASNADWNAVMVNDGLDEAANEIEHLREYKELLMQHCNNKANETDALREALQLIANHPVEQSGQWEVGAKEMQNIANSALKDPAALGYEIVKKVLKDHGLWEGD